jgi:nicotinate-nucleotide pyrophosphorylase (carboxylating)
MDESAVIQTLIGQALREDLGDQGDVTSRALFAPGKQAQAVIRSKAEGILAGAYLIEPVFHAVDPALTVSQPAAEGSRLSSGTEICLISGRLTSILAGERTVLNFLQRLSGIATKTNSMVSRIAGTGARLLDTRKTTPGLRLLEKKAVAAGGGTNHRFGLYDMILIKDTHVKAAGSPSAAVSKAREFAAERSGLRIEVEVQSVGEFRDAITALPDRIMLDNMNTQAMSQCVGIVWEKKLPIELEASGNVTEHTIRAIAETGVDYISCGALTHSAPALDIHLILTD